MSSVHLLSVFRAKLDLATWRYLIGYCSGYWKSAIIILLLATVQSMAFLPALILVRLAFDTALPQSNANMLLWIGAAMVGIRITSAITAIILRKISVKSVRAITYSLRCDLIQTIYGLSRLAYAEADIDTLQSRLVQDTERTEQMINAGLVNVIPTIFAGVTLFGVTVLLNWRLALAVSLVLPLLVVVNSITGPIVRTRLQQFHKAFEEFSLGISFSLRQLNLTHIHGYDREEISRQNLIADNVRAKGEAMALGFAIQGQLGQVVTGVAGATLIVFGGFAIIHKSMTIGDFIVFYMAIGILNGFVDRILASLPELMSGKVALSRLRAIAETESLAPQFGSKVLCFQGNIELKGVSFRFRERQILSGVSIDLVAGRTTAIVGPNGSGKSTIINLLLGFYAPDDGTIAADGVPYKMLGIRALRRSIGVVPQRPTFFQGTIAENISYGRVNPGFSDIQRAAERAHAAEFIDTLAAGYQTVIGGEGFVLSGGELQRIAIARALFDDPVMLIFDEPTNHLDISTIDALMRELTSGAGRPALLVVSHDASVIDYADEVWYLDGGQLLRRDKVTTV